MLTIRAATAEDHDSVWSIIEPAIRAGETLCLPEDMSRTEALAYWFSPTHQVFVAEGSGKPCGTYYLRPNQLGRGSHVGNCGYVTAQTATGQGVARAMCEHSLLIAKDRGFRSMQFNVVISTNDRAVRLWKSCGFRIIGTAPEAFLHPSQGFVDALMMHRSL